MGKWLLVIAQLLVCFFCFILFDLCIEGFPTGTPFFLFYIIWRLFSGHLSFTEFSEWISVD